MLARQQLLEAAEVRDQTVDDGTRQTRNLREQTVPEGADRGVEGVTDDGEPDRASASRRVEQFGGVDGLEVGYRVVEGQAGACLGEVVTDDEPEVVGQTPGQLLELEAEQAPVGAELDDVLGDLVLDAAHHLQALEHVGDVAHGDEVLDLEGRQRAGDLVEAGLVALEGLQGLVGARQDGAGVLEDDPTTGDVQRDDAHRLADGDDREAGLLRHPLGGAVPGAGLAGLDAGIGHELGRRSHDPRHVAVADDATVHLGQLAQPRRRELDVEREATGGEGLDDLVVAEDDEGTRATTKNAFEAVTQLGTGGHRREGGAQQLLVGQLRRHCESSGSVSPGRRCLRPLGASYPARASCRA
jgi:hypothetical protein